MFRHRARGEDGTSLVLVLVFISIFGLVIAGLLTEGGASVRYTNVVSDHEEKVYDADAGVAIGIQQIRQNNNLCPTVASAPMTIPVDPAFANGLSVTCQGATGATWGADGFAVILTSTADDALKTTNGQPKPIRGPVYVNGGLSSFALQKDLEVEGGNFYQNADNGGCTVGDAAPSVGEIKVVTPGYGYVCTDEDMPDPKHAPPGPAPDTSVFASGHRDPTTSTVSGEHCTIWYPGLYESAPVLAGGNNYFASGVYYFNFDGPLTVDSTPPPHAEDQLLWGGRPSLGEKPVFPLPACAKDPSVPEVTGTGVQFAFAKTARLYVGKDGQAELFARRDPTGTGTNGISFIAIPDEAAWTDPGSNWEPSTADTLVLDSDGGNGADIVLHSLVYAASQEVRLYANNSIKAQILGGIIAKALTIDSTASICADCMAISVVGGDPLARRVKVEATAPGTGGKAVVSTAIVAIANDPSTPPAVESWRTRSPIG